MVDDDHSQGVGLADAYAQALLSPNALVILVLADAKVLQRLTQQLRGCYCLVVDVGVDCAEQNKQRQIEPTVGDERVHSAC